MNDFLWHSLATPVVVAVATTLIVEYAAKPRLEARKARILRSRAEVDEFVYAAQRLGLLAGALPEPERLGENSALLAYAVEAITELETAAADAIRILSRLSTRYAMSHGTHIAKTARFLGFLRGRCRLAATEPLEHLHDLRAAAQDLEYFDIYFRVHVGLGDSQERLVKRLFWRLATQREYAAKADAVLERHGLRVPKAAE